MPNYYIIGSGITLANSEIKDIIKVTRSLENRRITSKKKLLVKKEDFSKLLGH